jgi:hypothetical protein
MSTGDYPQINKDVDKTVQDAFDLCFRKINSLQSKSDNLTYWPVGSVFTSIMSIDPSVQLGFGKWKSISVPSGLSAYMWKRTA